MPYEVSQLLKGLGQPVSAAADEPLQDALDRMLDNGFSQLPVVKKSGQQQQIYFVTHESILVALHTFGCTIKGCSLRVDDALVKVPNTYRSTDDLFELLMGMHELNAAVIVDEGGTLTHIVTTYDTSRYFRQWAEDIMQVRDVEYSLRRIINFAFKKPDGEIDEEARQSVVAEVTSANRAMRRKFGLAVSHYITQASSRAEAVRPELLDTAFLEFLMGDKLLIAPDGAGSNESGSSAEVANEADFSVRQLFAASQALRERFEIGVQSYLSRKPILAPADDVLVEDAFRFIHDRGERAKEFSELTLGDYIQIFFKDVCWGRCKGAVRLKEEEVKNMLEGVQKTRNALAHFREEEITAQQRAQLKVCADWLSAREKLIVAAFE